MITLFTKGVCDCNGPSRARESIKKNIDVETVSEAMAVPENKGYSKRETRKGLAVRSDFPIPLASP